MNNYYSITLQRTKEKYLKFRKRLSKSISSGRFDGYSRKKKNLLISRVEKYKERLEEMNVAFKGAAVAGSVLAAAAIPAHAKAEPSEKASDYSLLNERESEFGTLADIKALRPKKFEFENKLTGLSDLDGDDLSFDFATGALLVSSANFTEANANRGDIVGVLVAEGPEGATLSPDGITFTFATGDGINDADNGKFEIVNGNQLVVESSTTLDYETQSVFKLFINVDDGDLPADYAVTLLMRNSAESGEGTFDKDPASVSDFRMDDAIMADLDGDGIDELVFVGRETPYSGTRVFVQSIGGEGPTQIYGSGDVVRAADIDGDGDLDLVVGRTAYLRILENDGYGSFSLYNSIAHSFGSVRDLEVADFDQNGKMDFLIAGSSSSSVRLDNGSGMGINPTGSVYDLTVGDFDQDGFPDIAFIDSYSYIQVRQNSNGSFFNSAYMYTTSGSVRKVKFSDIDGDGDDDIIAVGESITTIENYGSSFSGASSVYLSTYVNDKNEIEIADIDGDGDDDIIVNDYYDINNFFGGKDQIKVFINDSGFGASQSFDSEVDGYGIRLLISGDIDNDDDLDLIVNRNVPGDSGRYDYESLSFENRNSAPYISSFNGKKRLDENAETGYLGTLGFFDINDDPITTTPFDGDNNNDLFSLVDENLYLTGNIDWEEVGNTITFQLELGDGYSTRVEDIVFNVNNLPEKGSGTFETEVTPLFGTQRTRSFMSGDVDNDGDQDLMKVSYTSGGEGGRITFDTQYPNSIFKQVESGAFADQPIIGTTSSFRHPLFVDFDNDGDLDIMGEFDGGEGNKIGRIINEDGNLRTTSSYGKKYAIDFMVSGDFDNDGITDVAVVNSYFSQEIIEFGLEYGGELDRKGSFLTNGDYTLVSGSLTNVTAGDFNNDGFDDLLLTVRNGDDVIVPGGEFGLDESAYFSAITKADYGYGESVVVDVDGDGDLDILLLGVEDNSNYASEISVFLNDGSATFTESQTISLGGEYGGEMAAGDIDGDGAPDIVTTSYYYDYDYESELNILSNDGNGSFSIVQTIEFDDFAGDIILMDVDGDDDNDIVFEYQKYGYATVLINGNVAPSDIGLSQSSLDENLAIDTEVATISVVDINAIDTHTISLVDGDGSNDIHNSFFRIDGDKLIITRNVKFEDTPELYINLLATDNEGATYEEPFTLTVNDVNQAPTALTLSTTTIEENVAAGSAVATIDATDANVGDEHEFELASGDGTNDADNDKFVIEGDQLIIKQNSSFETQSSYSIYLSASDSEGSVEQAFTLTVNNTNEIPTAITLSATVVEENVAAGTSVATIDATDVNTADEHEFELVSGDGTNDADNDKFVIEGNQLIIKQNSSFETQSSYNIYLSASDEEGSVEQAFTLTVNNTNELPTGITLSATSIEEMVTAGTAVATIDATDVNTADEHEFELVAGDGSNDADNGKFVIEGDQLIIKQNSNFETQSSYNIYLSASDSEGSVEQAFTLTVNNSNEIPTAITLSSTSIDETIAAGSAIATIDATDPNASDEHEFNLVAGDGTNDVDNGKFVIDGDQLIIKSSPNFETQSSYNIYLSASDGEGSVAQAFTIDVNNINSVPTGVQLSSTSFDEGIDAGSSVATLTAEDPDASDTHEFALTAGDGSNDADNGKFLIDGDQLIIKSSPNFETQASYNIYVSAADSEGSVTQAFELTVNNVNEVPTAITLSTTSMEETTPAGSAVATIDATDANESDEHEFELISGDGTNDADNSKFLIEGDQLIIKQDSRFETQESYNIYLSASDSEGTIAQAFVIDVVDVNQAPNSISLSITSLDESVSPGTTAATITTTDPNSGDTHTFSLVEGDGTNDQHNDLFVISGNKLILIEEVEFDELQSIRINIEANDGEESYTQSFTLIVNEVLGLADEVVNTLGVYPNPGGEKFTINLENNYRGNVQIRVIDLAGKEVHSLSKQKVSESFTYDVDMTRAESGIYVIELIADDDIISQRWVKE